MSIFESLLNISNDSDALDSYLRDNLAEIDTFCSTKVNIQRSELEKFEEFVLFKNIILENLDYSKSYNRAFIYYLMDYCERFCSKSTFVQLYRIIQDNKLNVGSRLEAAMLYLDKVPSNQVFIDRFDEICEKLQTAINEEDDEDTKSIATFLNYYSYVVDNTSEQFAKRLQSAYANAVNRSSYHFLNNEIIKECLAIDVIDTELFQTIQNKIDEILGKDIFIDIPNYAEYNDFLIETDTDYSNLLKDEPRGFRSIRDISVRQLNLYDNKDIIFYSLGRGVKILSEEAQLYSYINSYGKMHRAKMLSALEHLPLNDLKNENIEIFDWACGQGLASMIYFEYIENENVPQNIKRVVLLEPSEIALKRAALHIRHFNPQCQIYTIMKDIDSISNNDINSSIDTIKIHFFSNILDVEDFSIKHLISLIEQTQKGTNYFVCVSPYITEAKRARIDGFVQYFVDNYDSYQSYYEIDSQRGEWENDWTRVIRVFKI